MKHPLTNTRWQAIVNNDHNFDQKFYYGVLTTKIFCHPSCHSKLPNKDNVVIFTDASEALIRGFRPCKRCQPTGLKLPNDIWIDQVKLYLAKNYQKNLTLDLIAQDFHSSSSNLQRTFKRIVQQSPTDYLNSIRLKHAQELLVTTDYSIKVIASRCGYNSDTYFNTVFKQHLKMTPLKYKEFISEK